MSARKRKKTGNMSEIWKTLAYISQFGISMIVPIVLCFFVGFWLDNKLGTSYIAIILFFVGAVAGARNVYLLAKKYFGNK